MVGTVLSTFLDILIQFSKQLLLISLISHCRDMDLEKYCWSMSCTESVTERDAQSCPPNHNVVFPSVLNVILLYASLSLLIILVKKNIAFKFSSLAVTNWPALRFLAGLSSFHAINITEDITRHLDTFSLLCNLTNGPTSDSKLWFPRPV